MKLNARGVALAAAAFGLFGCASADVQGHCSGAGCDLGTGSGGNGARDMSDVPLPMPDLANGLGGFGDGCNDNKDCKSGICIATGTGGVCSDLCANNNCPPGYGCVGVTGQIDPGTVTYVCVPSSTQLCTPCSHDSECSVGGHDLCLPSPVGGHFCGRDCTKIGCPNGFACQDVAVGDAGMFKQCVPTSGSCDCDASKAGTTVACDITTPFGTCKGTRTCNGASGWSTTCAPPSATDVPDDDYKDDNCDGIDGDVTKGIFVAKAAASAVDDATCGTLAKPCKTINWGISQAANAAMRFVYVQAAVYNEEVVLFNGIDVVGGYDTSWQRAARGTTGHDVVITGAFDTTEQQFISVLAHNLAATTTMRDLDVYGPNANDGAHPGMSSYAVHAYKAKLTIHRVGVFGGNGGDGKTGSDGTNAPNVNSTAAMNGAVAPPTPPGPGNADEHATTCDNSGRGRGGDAGSNACPDDDNPNAGPGGGGGTMDSSCTCVLGVCGCAGSACNATAGLDGTTAATWGLGYGMAGLGGQAGNDGSTSYSTGGGSGGPGRVTNGAGGTSDARRAGFVVNNYWFAFGGVAGLLGKNGTGGGGGGGSGGDDAGIDSWGAGGGGGGAGGCRARAAGQGGQGGGGSFGVFAVQSTISAEMCAFQIGNGGAGGAGGRGGTGQNGGAGAPGGLASGDSKAGGPGGNGAHGGHSGAGGGGNGGIAYGIFSLSSTVNDSSTYTGGSAGAAGSGGAAAAPAPGGVNDGNAGANGNPGLTNGVGSCAAAGGC